MKCKNCNKNESVKYSKYTAGNFCCKNCAIQYSSNFNRTETNRKISKSYAIQNITSIKLKFCFSCASIINENHTQSKYCLICQKYFNNKKLFEKLDIKETNLKIASSLALDKLKEMYFGQKKSLLDIYKKYGIKENTVFWFFKKHNIPLRSISKSNRIAFALGKGDIHSPYNGSIHKSEWYTTWFGQNVFLKSSYEKKFALHLDSLKVYYEVNKKRIRYIFENEEHTYITDFYIPDWNLIVETKARYFYEENKEKTDAKMKASESAGYKVLLLIDNEIDEYINK